MPSGIFKRSKEALTNMKLAAQGRNKGLKRSEETKAKMKDSALKAHREGRHGGFKIGHPSYWTDQMRINQSKRLKKDKVPYSCTICGKVRYFLPARAANSLTCGKKECISKYLSIHYSGKNNSNFKEGYSITPQGYILVSRNMIGLSVDKNKHHKILFHRFMAEVILGRKLKHSEVIHHIDENRSNNNPENLYYYSSNGSHLLDHRRHALPEKSNLEQIRRHEDMLKGILTLTKTDEFRSKLTIERGKDTNTTNNVVIECI